jgi:hypothetical protein
LHYLCEIYLIIDLKKVIKLQARKKKDKMAEQEEIRERTKDLSPED